MNKERKLNHRRQLEDEQNRGRGAGPGQGIENRTGQFKEVDIVVCPPFTALAAVSKAVLDSNIRLGAQNMSEHNFGASPARSPPGCSRNFPSATSSSAIPNGGNTRRKATS
jgi:hypothetical protein